MEENELDDEMVNKLCMYMRVIDLFQKNSHEIEDNEELKESIKDLKSQVKILMDMLSDEEQNLVLEVYQLQKQEMEKVHKQTSD